MQFFLVSWHVLKILSGDLDEEEGNANFVHCTKYIQIGIALDHFLLLLGTKQEYPSLVSAAEIEWNKQNLNANFHKNYWLDVNNRLRTVTYRPQKILYYEALPTWGKASTILERTKKMQPK